MLFQHLSRKQILIMSLLSAVLISFAVIFYVTTSGDSKELISTSTPLAASKCYKTTPNTKNSTLELVHIVFRHGPRTPVDTYPNDPYVNDGFEPTGWGHVTNKGKQELFEIGKWLQRRYGDYLGTVYMPDRIHAQATASPRALMSLQTVLASLFPPHGTPMEWNNELDWQPIPIVSQPLEQDSLLLVRTPCPRYFEAREEIFKRPEVIAELAPYRTLFKELTNLTGMPITSAEDVNSLYITLLAEQEFGYKLPAWTRKYFPERMQFLAEQSYVYNAYTPEMQKIKGGPFLEKMYREMLQKRVNTLKPNNRQMYIYTGHDWTVGNILSALQVWERQMPRFSVMAIFEMHKNKQTGEYYVEIFLRNDEFGCAKQLKLPNCDWQCPLDQLIELSANVLPSDSYEQRCKAHSDNFVEPPPRPIDQYSANGADGETTENNSVPSSNGKKQ